MYANAVDTGTGAYVFERTLLTVQGGRSMVFDMSCNSLLTSGMGSLGRGCGHPYESRVDGDPEDIVILHWDANRRNHFRFAGEGNDYEPLEQTVLYDKLRRDGQGWELILLDGTTYKYDAVGNLQSIANKIEQRLEVQRIDGTPSAIFEPIANKRIFLKYRQDGSGLLQHLQDANNRVVFFDYDSDGRLNEIRDPAKLDITSYGGNFSSLPIPDDSPAGVTRSFNVPRTDLIGLVMLNSLQINHPRPTDLLVRIESPSGTFVEFTTDRVLPNWDATDMIFDEFEGEDPQGTWNVRVFDTQGGETGTLNTARIIFTDPTNIYRLMHNGAGQISTIIAPDGDTIVTNSYDSFGRVVAQDDGLNTNELATFAYEETGSGLTTTYKDRVGAVSTLEYDRDYNLLAETEPLGHTKTFQYDSLGNRTVMTDALGRSWNYSYDSMGNVTSVRDPAGNTTTFEYDNRNNLTAVRDAMGHESKFTYNAKNNITKATDSLPFGHEDNQGYSGSSQPTSALLDDGGGITFGYSNGMATTFGHPVSGSAGVTYDNVGRIRSMTDGDGKTIKLTYDPRDLVVQREDQLGNIHIFEFDVRGRRVKETDPRGNVMRRVRRQ